MVKAEIHIKSNKGKAPDRLADEIRASLKARGIQATVHIKERVLYVEGEISKNELKTIASHSPVPYNIVFEEKTTTQEEPEYPKDYNALKQMVADHREQIRRQKGEIFVLKTGMSDLEAMAKKEKSRYEGEINGLQAKIHQFESRCSQPTNIQDFLSETMLRESAFWGCFIKFYTDTLQTESDLYKIPLSDLEKECLDYVELSRREEFTQIDKQRKMAEEARTKARENPFIKLDARAGGVLENYKRLLERDEQIRDTRKELCGFVAEKKIRVALTKDAGETLITLPFKYEGQSPQDYGVAERELVSCITCSLNQSSSEFVLENFNGLLRYKILGMKTRAKNSVLKAISICEDAFTKLGGAREIIGIELYETN